MIILDTDVMIDILRQYLPALAWLSFLGEEEVALPGFVIMELIQGCKNKAEQEKMERELGAYRVAWPSPEICDKALSVFARYYLSHGPGILDALIGQMAVDLNLPLYTFNQKHYAAIPNLETCNPMRKNHRNK